MTPLTMSEAEEAEMRRRAKLEACSDSHGWLAARRAFSEIDALRRLPVIATCGDCRWCRVDVCAHEHAHIELEINDVNDAPPYWCPLRGTP